MALIKCPGCGNDISDQAKSCPHCGALNAYSIPQVPKKHKGQICLWISMIISAFYLGFSIPYWMNAGSGASSAVESIASGIAATIVFPHLICAIIAVIFNLFAIIMYKPGFALASAILYTVSMVLFPMYWMFIAVQVVLMYVAFARMKSGLKD